MHRSEHSIQAKALVQRSIQITKRSVGGVSGEGGPAVTELEYCNPLAAALVRFGLGRNVGHGHHNYASCMSKDDCALKRGWGGGETLPSFVSSLPTCLHHKSLWHFVSALPVSLRFQSVPAMPVLQHLTSVN